METGSSDVAMEPLDLSSTPSEDSPRPTAKKTEVPLPRAPAKPFFRFSSPLPAKQPRMAPPPQVNQPPQRQVPVSMHQTAPPPRGRLFLNAPPSQNRAIKPRISPQQSQNSQQFRKPPVSQIYGNAPIAPRPVSNQQRPQHHLTGASSVIHPNIKRFPTYNPPRGSPPPLLQPNRNRPMNPSSFIPSSSNSNEVPRHNSPFMTPLSTEHLAKQEPLKQTTRVAFKNSPEFSLVHVQGSPTRKPPPIIPKPQPGSINRPTYPPPDYQKQRVNFSGYLQPGPKPPQNHLISPGQRPIYPQVGPHERCLNPNSVRPQNDIGFRPSLPNGLHRQRPPVQSFPGRILNPATSQSIDRPRTSVIQTFRPTTSFKCGRSYKPAALNIDLMSIVAKASPLREIFSWADYLSTSKGNPAADSCFPHVMALNYNGFAEGFLLEVPVDDKFSGYWVASILHSSGQNLLVRFAGFDGAEGEKWIDLMKTPVHGVGWSVKNGKKYIPPPRYPLPQEESQTFLNKFMCNKLGVTEEIIKARYFWKIEKRIPIGSRFEFEYEPNKVWMVRVIENFSGLLVLRYEGITEETRDIVQFFTSKKLHPIGFAISKHSFLINPPDFLAAMFKEDLLIEIYKRGIALNDQFSVNICNRDHLKTRGPPLHKNLAQVGMKLEVLSNEYPNHIYPGTVVEIIDDCHIRVIIDDLSPSHHCKKRPSQIVHRKSFGIFPVNWCYDNNLPLACPNGFSRDSFDWNEYLAVSKSTCVPKEFFKSLTTSCGFKQEDRIEICNPLNPKIMCPATILKVVHRLLIVEIDGWVNSLDEPVTVFLDSRSDLIFPVDFCQASQKLSLLPPPNFRPSGSNARVPKSEPINREQEISNSAMASVRSREIEREMFLRRTKCKFNQEYWCESLFVNHRCSIGSLLSRKRVADLPQKMGPGLTVHVLRDMITALINCSYTPSQSLKDLVLVCTGSDFGEDFCKVQIKAKLKAKNMKANVKFPEKQTDGMSFLREVLERFGCCQNLISEECYPGNACVSADCIAALGATDGILEAPESPSSFTTATQKKFTKTRKRKKRKAFFTVAKKRAVNNNGTVEGRNEPNSDESVNGSRPATPRSESGEDELEKHITVERKRGLIRSKRLQGNAPPEREKSKRHKSVFSTVNMIAKQEDPIAGFRPISPCLNSERVSPVRTEAKSNQQNGTEPLIKLRKLPDPSNWTTEELCSYLESTDCKEFSEIARKESIDGAAFLLTSLPVLIEACNLKLGTALKVCYQTEKLKRQALCLSDPVTAAEK